MILGNYLTGNKHSIYLLQIGFTIEALSTDLKDRLANTLTFLCHVMWLMSWKILLVSRNWQSLKRTFYQSSEFPVSRPMLNSLWKMFNLFPLPDLVTLKGNNRHHMTISSFFVNLWFQFQHARRAFIYPRRRCEDGNIFWPCLFWKSVQENHRIHSRKPNRKSTFYPYRRCSLH